MILMLFLWSQVSRKTEVYARIWKNRPVGHFLIRCVNVTLTRSWNHQNSTKRFRIKKNLDIRKKFTKLLRKTAQNVKFLRCAKTCKTAQNSAKCEIFAKRKTAQNAQNFGFAAQNSAKSAEFGRAKTAQKQSAKLHNAHPCSHWFSR